jgi:thiamine kinase-like enzyme
VPNTASLSAALATWRQWPLALTRPPTVLGTIKGGRTNHNIKIALPEAKQTAIVRLHNRHSRALGINRHDEAIILDSAARAGIAPAPIYHDPQQRFVIQPFIAARVWQADDFAQPSQRQRLLQLLNQVRQLQPATHRRSYHRYLQHYMQQLQAANAVPNTLQQQWQHFAPRLRQFDQAPWRPQLTHHDVIPENILDTGERLYLIDWEYAALGHPDIDRWCLDPPLAQEPFIAELAQWTNDLWERLTALLPQSDDE